MQNTTHPFLVIHAGSVYTICVLIISYFTWGAMYEHLRVVPLGKPQATLVPSIIKLLYRQTIKAQSERSNRVPEGGKKSQRDRSTSLKQARAPGTDITELS